MSKRNLTLLIIGMVIALIAIFAWLYSSPTPENGDGTDGGGTNFLSRFNPFATTKPTPSPEPTPNEGGEEPPVIIETGELRIKKVSTMPVAGFGVYQKERYKEVPFTPPVEQTGDTKNTTKPTPPATEFVPALRYVDRINGNIYQTFADKIDERKFTTTVIPKVYEAYIGNKGTTVVMRYLKPDDKTIQTFVGTLPKEVLGGDTTGDNAVVGSFLPDNITDLSISLDASKIFYLFNMGIDSDNVIGTTLELLSGKKTQVLDSAFTEWLSAWQSPRYITLTTKPAAGVAGYLYAIDLTNKSLSRIMGDVSGLTTLMSPSGKLVLYSDSALALSLYNTDTKTSTSLGLRTLPEKCVWSKASDVAYCSVPVSLLGVAYPDSWYKGEVSFTDQIWKIDMDTGTTSLILDPSTIQGGEAIDGTKLMLDESENYLFFVNKKDSYLWEFILR